MWFPIRFGAPRWFSRRRAVWGPLRQGEEDLEPAQGHLSLAEGFFGHFPQFKSRPLGSLYREFEEIPESHLKVTEKPLKMSQFFCDICDIPVEWWLHQGIPSYRRKLVHLLGDELPRREMFFGAVVVGLFFQSGMGQNMSKPMIFHILGRMNNQLCQLFGASPGYQGFDPYTFHCLFFYSVFLDHWWIDDYFCPRVA